VSPSGPVDRRGRNAPHAVGELGRRTLGPACGRRLQRLLTRLFIGNLSFQATAEDVRELFQHAGTVGAVRIITDQFTGRSCSGALPDIRSASPTMSWSAPTEACRRSTILRRLICEM
jgi:RNA recognition motif-containing protein